MPAGRKAQGDYQAPPLREQHGDRMDVWHIVPPDPGRPFVVLECVWTGTDRHIYDWAWVEQRGV